MIGTESLKKVHLMPKNFNFRPLLPFFTILIFMLIAYAFNHLHPISWTNLKSFQLNLRNFADIHPAMTPFLFMCVYILYALLSLPGIFVLSLLAGSLFNQPLSTLYVTIAATTGASLLFLAARTAFGQLFYQKAEKRMLNKIKHGFQSNAASYLLFLRLIPLFPFWIVNIAGAFFKVKFNTFVWTTFFGMIPSVFIYTQAGKGLTVLLHSANPLNPINLFNSYLVAALLGLAFLSLLPLLFKQT